MSDEGTSVTGHNWKAQIEDCEHIAENCIASGCLIDAAKVLLDVAQTLYDDCPDDHLMQKRAFAFASKSFECNRTLQSVFAIISIGRFLAHTFHESDEVVHVCEAVCAQCDSDVSDEWVEARALLLVLQANVEWGYDRDSALMHWEQASDMGNAIAKRALAAAIATDDYDRALKLAKEASDDMPEFKIDLARLMESVNVYESKRIYEECLKDCLDEKSKEEICLALARLLESMGDFDASAVYYKALESGILDAEISVESRAALDRINNWRERGIFSRLRYWWQKPWPSCKPFWIGPKDGEIESGVFDNCMCPLFAFRDKRGWRGLYCLGLSGSYDEVDNFVLEYDAVREVSGPWPKAGLFGLNSTELDHMKSLYVLAPERYRYQILSVKKRLTLQYQGSRIVG